MKQKLKSFVSLTTIAVLLVANLAGCSSGVKLDTPVEDRNGLSTLGGAGGAGSGTGSGIGSGSGTGIGSASGSGSGNFGTSSTSLNGSGSNANLGTVDLSSSGTGVNGGPVNVTKTIYFDFDSYLVKPEYASVINAHVQFLATRMNSKISVEGHTDNSGGREYNLALGQKRAEAVRRAMALSGLSENQIEAISFGKEKPVDSGASDSAAAKNRRAEIIYR